jgi:predicted HTH domain antitoxin
MKQKHIELEIPEDIAFSLEKEGKSRDISGEIKKAIAVNMFQREVISLGKAAELAGMSRVAFIELLKDYNIPAYNYREKDYKEDQKSVKNVS